jgi:membrane protein required for colicin V production
MNAVDILILLVLGAGAFMGYVRGLISQAGHIAGVVAGMVLCRVLGPMVAGWFNADEPSAFTSAASYAIVFFASYVAAWASIRAVREAIRAVHLGIADRIGGAIFKAALWGLALSFVLNLSTLVLGPEAIAHDDSKPWRGAVMDFAPSVMGFLSEIHADNDQNTNSIVNERE